MCLYADTGMDVSGHMYIHSEQCPYTFVFIEWALYRAKFPLLLLPDISGRKMSCHSLRKITERIT